MLGYDCFLAVDSTTVPFYFGACFHKIVAEDTPYFSWGIMLLFYGVILKKNNVGTRNALYSFNGVFVFGFSCYLDPFSFAVDLSVGDLALSYF
jgi:hypothetical protein